MTIDEFDQRVIEGLSALADEAEPNAALRSRALSPASDRARISRRWLLPAAAVVMAVALLGTALAVVTNGDDKTDVSTITEGVDGADEETAQDVVEQFMDALRVGDVDRATRFVSSYADGWGEARRRGLVEEWLAEHRPFVGAEDLQYATTKSFGWTPESVLDVVTVTAPVGDSGDKTALAFVVGSSSERPDGPGIQIHRLGSDLGSAPPPGSTLTPGDMVVVASVPLEGGATAHINGREVEAVVDHVAMSTSVQIPAWAVDDDDFVLTMSFASPELPGAGAAWFRVGGARTKPTPGPPLEEDIVFLYTSGAEVRAVLRSGAERSLRNVGPRPHLAPDGRTVLFARGEWPNQETIVFDARTGEERSLGAVGQGGYFDLDAAFSRTSRVAFAVLDNDGGNTVRIEIRSTSDFAVERTVELGPASARKHYIGMAWDADAGGLLVFTWDTEESWSWWWVDADEGTATAVDVSEALNPRQHESFFLGSARAPGVFPVLLRGGWGELRVSTDGDADFRPTETPGPRLEGEIHADRIWDVGILRIRRAEDRSFVIDDGPTGGQLVSYWEVYREESGQLVYVAPDGTADILLEDVGWIDVAAP